jgi:hypothetical protein
MFEDYQFDRHEEHHDPFNALQHAIADAELLLLYFYAEDGGRLPWTQEEAFFVVPGPFAESKCFYYDIVEDLCFSVSSDEILTPEQVFANWPACEKADRDEVNSFVQHEVFRLARKQDSNNTVDGVWIRKWKDRAEEIIKSRCCGRGFLDKQNSTIDEHSSTASRLSNHWIHAICTVHVDDLLVLANWDFLEWLAGILEMKFGKSKRNRLTFVHLGISYERLARDHISLNQVHHLVKKDNLPLDPVEHQTFRSTLCSLLWICNTTGIIAHRVVALQSEMATSVDEALEGSQCFA